jgi:dihydroorotate dehydrogenase
VGGIRLKNPIICGSGEHVMTEGGLAAAIDSGIAAVVAKSAGESSVATRRQLDGAKYVLLAPDWSLESWGAPTPGASLLNRSGLVPVPFDEWAATVGRSDLYAAERDAYVIGSVLPATAEQASDLSLRMQAAGVRWIELNLSAPHATEADDHILRVEEPAAVAAIVRSVRAVLDGPLTVKLTSETGDVVALAAAARGAGADSVGLCGRRMGFLPDPVTGRPLLDTFAAFGGSWELPLTLRWIAKTRLQLGPELPIIGTGGARCALDVVRFLLAGATAVQLATAVYAGGFAILRHVLEELARFIEQRSVTVSDLIGVAADAALTYAEVSDDVR